MFEICRFDAEILSSEGSSPLASEKVFSEMREEEYVESLSNEFKFSFNFSLILIEDVSLMSLIKEKVKDYLQR